MKPLFAPFIAGCMLMVVAAGAFWAWQTGSQRPLGSGRIDDAKPLESLYCVGFAARTGTRRLSCTNTTALITRAPPKSCTMFRRSPSRRAASTMAQIGALLSMIAVRSGPIILTAAKSRVVAST